jgi:hypothetical protein
MIFVNEVMAHQGKRAASGREFRRRGRAPRRCATCADSAPRASGEESGAIMVAVSAATWLATASAPRPNTGLIPIIDGRPAHHAHRADPAPEFSWSADGHRGALSHLPGKIVAVNF